MPGDVLFSKDGTVGRTVVIRQQRSFVVASSLIIIRPNQKILTPDFLDFVCQSATVQQQVDSYVKGAGLPRLSIANLRRVVIPVPPLHEQAEIVQYLEVRTTEIDALVTKARVAIATFVEYRSALISDAVTGKIDVREMV